MWTRCSRWSSSRWVPFVGAVGDRYGGWGARVAHRARLRPVNSPQRVRLRCCQAAQHALSVGVQATLPKLAEVAGQRGGFVADVAAVRCTALPHVGAQDETIQGQMATAEAVRAPGLVKHG